MVTLAEQVQALIAQASPDTVPSGVLLWFGATDLPDGNSSSPAPLTTAEWGAIYARLTGGALPQMSKMPRSVIGSAVQPGEPVPVAIAVVNYHRPTADVTAAVLDAGRRGTPAEIPSSLAEAIEPATAVLATTLLADQWHRATPAYRGRTVRLVVPASTLITNIGSTPLTDIEIDTGDGFQQVALGGSVTVQVAPAVDTLTIRVRCRSEQGTHVGACSLAVTDDPVPPAPDEVWRLGALSGNTGHAYVFRTPGAGPTTPLRRPILIAEGWPGGASPQMLAEAVGQRGLMDRWHANGHDVVMVGFSNGLDAIERNAAVMQAAIASAWERTADPLVVGGMSMGGLVSRYALLQLEHQGIDTRTAVYLSIDVPHGPGAYTSLAGQWMVNHFAALSPTYVALKAALGSASNVQYLALVDLPDGVGPHPLRTKLLAELEAMGGQPRHSVKLAVACGRGSGGGTTPPPTAPVMSWQVPGIADVTLWPMPAAGKGVVAEGSTLAVPGPPPPPLIATSSCCWEVVPGALNVIATWVTSVVQSLGFTVDTTLGIASSMPTVSALDMQLDPNAAIPPPGSGVSPFDDYLCADTDQFHLALTPAHVDWLVDRVERHQPVATNIPAGDTAGAASEGSRRA